MTFSTVLLTVQAGSSWGAARVAEAGYCLAIAVASEAKEDLAERFDVFARDANLEIDASHPMMRVYYPPGAGVRYPTDSSVMIDLQKMGPLGSILSYHVLEHEGVPTGLLDDLRQFVAAEIAGSYETTPCEDIDGFTAPTIYY